MSNHVELNCCNRAKEVRRMMKRLTMKRPSYQALHFPLTSQTQSNSIRAETKNINWDQVER